MLADAAISAVHWAVFVVAVLFFLALDLGVFHRHAHVVKFREAVSWTVVWFSISMLFGFLVAPRMVPSWGPEQTAQFVTGYIIELSLSMDNVFVIAVIFSYFGVPRQFQHRVLFWGILGALVMRGVMIWLGAEMLKRFDVMFYVLGVFLILTGIRMVFSREEQVHPEKNVAVRLARRLFPVSTCFDGQHFATRLADGRWALTPLALVLLMVETTDLIFAVDSIPAIFAVTTNSFIVFTSNVFAILGLRSMYFVLAGAIGYFRYLKLGLSVVLVYIGVKMILGKLDQHIPTTLSLGIVAGILLVSIVASLVAAWREKEREPSP
jgi:tellurite resistance protein TerC